MRIFDKTDLLIGLTLIAIFTIIWWMKEVILEEKESDFDKEIKYDNWLKNPEVKSKDTIVEFLEDEVKKFDEWEKENK